MTTVHPATPTPRTIGDLARYLSRRFRDEVRWVPRDLWDSISGSRGDLVPPRRLNFVGGTDFEAVGQEFLAYFRELGGLRPEHAVLDVGCGVGRMAVPLTQFLTQGKYEGFDIVRRGIRWCTHAIARRFANFRFRHANIYNKHYNPFGTIRASSFRFPYDDQSFDFVFATSVFTHMLPADAANYLHEIARVLKADGRALITVFLMNQESETLMRAGGSVLAFRRLSDGCWTVSDDDPEAAIAYDETRMVALFEAAGLKIISPIRYGRWPGPREHTSYQDLVIVGKA